MYALNTIVYKSNQKDAGMGLFVLERAEKGDRVAVYAGELITQKEADESDSEYILYIKMIRCWMQRMCSAGKEGTYATQDQAQLVMQG